MRLRFTDTEGRMCFVDHGDVIGAVRVDYSRASNEAHTQLLLARSARAMYVRETPEQILEALEKAAKEHEEAYGW